MPIPTAAEIDIANAVVDRIKTLDFSSHGSLIPERGYTFGFKLAELAKGKVIARPADDDRAAEDREPSERRDYTIQVGTLKSVKKNNVNQIDLWLNLTVAIANLFPINLEITIGSRRYRVTGNRFAPLMFQEPQKTLDMEEASDVRFDSRLLLTLTDDSVPAPGTDGDDGGGDDVTGDEGGTLLDGVVGEEFVIDGAGFDTDTTSGSGDFPIDGVVGEEFVIEGTGFDSLVGHWPLNEGSGTSAGDDSGNGQDLDFVPIDGANTTALPVWDPDTPGSQAGPGGCLMAPTGMAAVSASGLTGFPTENEPRSACFWFKGNSGSYFAYGNDLNASSDYVIFARSTPEISDTVFADGDGSLACDDAVSNTDWHHYAFTWDGTNWKFYQDGAIAASGTRSALATEQGWTQIKMVGSKIKDVRLYNYALSAAEVAALWN